MRKIISKAEQEKKQKKNSLIVGIILIGVLFFSVFGAFTNLFGSSDEESKFEYKGYNFIKSNELWDVSIGNFDFVFHYLPENATEINEELKFLDNYLNKPLYVLSEDYNSKIEVYYNLQDVAERIQPACLDEENCEGDYPVKTCENNFIIIQEGEFNVTQQNNCVFIKGKKEELLKITEGVLYKIIDVK